MTRYTDPAQPTPAPSFSVGYRYLSPSRAGPFKGRTVLSYRPCKGDELHATFGRAVITSVQRAKAPACPA